MANSAGFNLLRLAGHARTACLALAALSLVGCPSGLEEAENGLKSKSVPVRLRAVQGLAKARSARALELITGATGDPDARVRLAALRAIEARGRKPSLFALVGRLEDPDPATRVLAIRLLAKFYPLAAKGRLLPLLDHRDPLTRRATRLALVAAGMSLADQRRQLALRNVQQHLRELSATPERKVAALQALARTGDVSHATAIRRALADPTGAVVRAAAQALVRLTPKEAASALKAAVGQPRWIAAAVAAVDAPELWRKVLASDAGVQRRFLMALQRYPKHALKLEPVLCRHIANRQAPWALRVAASKALSTANQPTCGTLDQKLSSEFARLSNPSVLWRAAEVLAARPNHPLRLKLIGTVLEGFIGEGRSWIRNWSDLDPAPLKPAPKRPDKRKRLEDLLAKYPQRKKAPLEGDALLPPTISAEQMAKLLSLSGRLLAAQRLRAQALKGGGRLAELVAQEISRWPVVAVTAPELRAAAAAAPAELRRALCAFLDNGNDYAIKLLDRGDPESRFAGASCAARRKIAAAGDRLFKLAKGGDALLPLQALVAIGDQRAAGLVRSRLQRGHAAHQADERATVVRLWLETPQTPPREPLVDAMFHPQAEVRLAALEVISKRKVAIERPHLDACNVDQELRVRQACRAYSSK